jgi:hypothetical protein
MKRLFASLVVILVVGSLSLGQDRYDGSDEILAVVNGQAITYQEIAGDTDMQAEINAARSIRGVPPDVSDAEIERQIVSLRLQSYVLQKLLDDEADRVQLKISDSQMRAIINREKKLLGLPDEDVKAWATYLKEKFNLSPSEYRDRRREEIRRGEIMNYMAGLYGALPPSFPLEVYFSMSVTPKDVREEFDRTAERWRVARNIDYREFRLIFPQETTQAVRTKLGQAVVEGETSVHARVVEGESFEAASEGLKRLVEDDLKLPGVTIDLGKRQTVGDDRDLRPIAYKMVLSVPTTGGVSEVGGDEFQDEEGQRFEVYTFIQLFSREDGDLRDFESPKVQEGIRATIANQRLAQNRVKVEQALLKRAAIVPENLFAR